MIITGFIAHKEWQKRRAGVNFTTKSLKIWSALCIFSGPLIGFCIFALYFDGFCYFTWYFIGVTILYQPVFMGLYQLSRLYYCFANNQVYSNKGYPNWLFNIMFGLGYFSMMGSPIAILFTDANRFFHSPTMTI